MPSLLTINFQHLFVHHPPWQNKKFLKLEMEQGIGFQRWQISEQHCLLHSCSFFSLQGIMKNLRKPLQAVMKSHKPELCSRRVLEGRKFPESHGLLSRPMPTNSAGATLKGVLSSLTEMLPCLGRVRLWALDGFISKPGASDLGLILKFILNLGQRY